MKKIRHPDGSNKILLGLYKQSFGISTKSMLYQISDLVDWAFMESMNDLQSEKLIKPFTNMYDASENFYQLTNKGEKFLEDSIRIQITRKLNKRKTRCCN